MEFTSEQQAIQSEIQSFVAGEIIPEAREFDARGALTPDIIPKLGQMGYLGALLPEEYGGRGMNMLTLAIMHEEIGRGCSSVRSLLTVHGMTALAILKWGTPAQRDYWLNKLATGSAIGAFALTEPNVGSDAKSIETTAIPVADDYVLNGKKRWITFGQIADVFLLFARLDGKPTAFLVEKNSPGFSIKPVSGLLGLRASGTAELEMVECRIPKENLLGGPGFGLSHVALHSLDYGRYSIACGSVGIGQACLDECIQYARKRKQFGEPLRHHQLIQKMITEMVVNVKAARLLCYNAGYLKDNGDPDSIMETWNAKYFASTMLEKITSDAVQIHGANGCSSEYPVERYYRDAKIMAIIEGTTQMHEVLIATNAFRNLS
jgi:alkylation response protein AidB-like acyl-CoA dehydrogenase